MRAFERLTARWLARTSSVGRTVSPKACRRLAPRMSVPSGATVMKERKHEERGNIRPGQPLRQDDLVRRVELAFVREREAVRDDHRDEAGVLLEALADEVLDLPALAARGADLVHLRRLVPDRDGGELEARDLARRADAGVDDVLLRQRRAERLRGAIELPLLDLRPLQLHEDALVLDRAEAVARRLGDELVLVRRERAVLDAVEGEDAADDAVVDDRDRRERAHRARRSRSTAPCTRGGGSRGAPPPSWR